MLSNKHPLQCRKVKFSVPRLIVILCYVVTSMYSIRHYVPTTCAHPHSSENAEDVLMCLMKSLFIMTLLRQKMEAAYYDNIIEQQRIEPEFFRMGFYGRKFPFFLRVRFTKLVHWVCAGTVMSLLMWTATQLLQASAGNNVSYRRLCRTVSTGWKIQTGYLTVNQEHSATFNYLDII